MYSAKTHGKTLGKELSRTMVNKYIMSLVDTFGRKNLRGVSLPADAYVQETDLQHITSAENISSTITCLELDLDTYMSVPYKIIPDGVDYQYKTFEAYVREARTDQSKRADWFWFDACGQALREGKLKGSRIEVFVEAIGKVLKRRGIGFFTASIWPIRSLSAAEQYSILTGEPMKDKPTYEQMMNAYIKLLQNTLPEDCHVRFNLTYKAVSGMAFFVIGVSKGWEAAPYTQSLLEGT